MLQLLWCSGSWRDQEFKAYNFNALGLPPTGGYLHPLLKVSQLASQPPVRFAKSQFHQKSIEPKLLLFYTPRLGDNRR